MYKGEILMKKFLTLRNVVLCFAAALVLAALIMSFFVSLNATFMGQTGSYKHILWGCDKAILEGQEVPVSEMGTYTDKTIKAMALPLAGLIMMVVAAVGAVLVALFVKKPFAKYVVAGLGLVILAGGIMQFWPIESFSRASVLSMKGIEGASKEEIKEAVEFYTKMFKEAGANAPVAIVMGVLGCLSGVAVAASQFLPEKK